VVVSADRVSRDQRLQRWIESFEPAQSTVAVRRLHDEQVAHVWSAELAAQPLVLNQQIFGNRRQAREIVLPELLRR
jgi:hypothetical protein